MAERQNVLFVIMDQMRADCLHGALGAAAELPHLRALMADGVSFASHFSVCAPCGPARASILTGQYAMNHRSVRNGTPLRHDTPNLAGEMRKAGYAPRLYGYTDTTMDPRAFGADDPRLHSYEQVMPGFDEVVRMRADSDISAWIEYLKNKGYPSDIEEKINQPDGDSPDDPARYAASDSDTAWLTDRMLEDLANQPRGWFAHLTYIRPHPPFVAPSPYNRMFDPANMPAPLKAATEAEERAWHPFVASSLDAVPISSVVSGFPELQASDTVVATMRALYLGLVAEVDHHLGRIVAWLKQSGQYDDTLIVVTSDHGEMLGDRHAWGKRTFYNAAYHVPLIIRDPRHPAAFGRVVEAATESVDITPTLLDQAGQAVPDAMDGRSLRPFLRGETPESWRSYSYSELDFGDPVTPTVWQAQLGLHADECNLAILRDGQHTLVHFAGGLPQILFRQGEAGEDRDISGDNDSAAILLEMSRKMLCHRMANPDGTFAGTMVTGQGVKAG